MNSVSHGCEKLAKERGAQASSPSYKSLYKQDLEPSGHTKQKSMIILEPSGHTKQTRGSQRSARPRHPPSPPKNFRSLCFKYCPIAFYSGAGRGFFVDYLLVRIHCIVETIWWPGLAPWEFEFPRPGSCISNFLVIGARSGWVRQILS